jgi:hypothetical protein
MRALGSLLRYSDCVKGRTHDSRDRSTMRPKKEATGPAGEATQRAMASQPVAVVCRVLGAPRSSIYARRASAGARGRPGPATAISDPDLVGLIHQVLAVSPFAGEGYRTVRARLRRQHGVRVSGNGSCGGPAGKASWRPSGSVAGANRGPMTARSSPTCPTSAGAPTRPWPGPAAMGGCGCSPVWITTAPRRGRMWPRSGIASLPCSRSMTRSSTAGAGWMPTSPAVWGSAMTGDPKSVQEPGHCSHVPLNEPVYHWRWWRRYSNPKQGA